jgi:hypothetical protein
MGAIRVGKTICGTLFGASVFLGSLYGMNEAHPPAVQDEKRLKAIDAVEGLYRGFIERFGHTECRTLTECDWTREEDRARYRQEEVFERKCCEYLDYVLAACLQRVRESSPPPNP